MSLFSAFMANQAVNLLEREFLSHEPAMQADFLLEVQKFAEIVGEWLKNKVNQDIVIKQ